jgi:20S proteasome alpha/beta subunit
MALVLALKNSNSVVVASDTSQTSVEALTFSPFMQLPGGSILLMTGSIEALRPSIEAKVIPQLGAATTAAALVQIIHAALVLDVVPHLAQLKGRVELIVAGIDPVRHIKEPSIYYLDSARDFDLTIARGNFAAAGATAAVAQVLSGRGLQHATNEELTDLAKECLASTRMRWPQSVAPHQRIGIITEDYTHILNL